jgi:hypothetical protein
MFPLILPLDHVFYRRNLLLEALNEETCEPLLPACRNPDLSGLLHFAEFRHTPTEVAPLHGIRAKAQGSLVGG